ncbi:nucleotide-binding universal stress UspA family protein [Tenacibaculum adriaticum]|uniref:Nucleotide-binding universal stress UspA family protein n=1 Tax=Tenacibaculum adriaticum TaxID=413713 RepID=A0A5S5DZ09_9FLAO|nr:universal stress protein [Tenacibaculum adriaticum]TYQ00267.1 nucleotide-binding universal stress UspA family protein [Tenacibaculum adriaticum]
MKKKILLPTDFSRNSINAINYARELYVNDKCDFFVLNVFFAGGNFADILTTPEIHQEIYDKAELESKEGVEKIIYDIKDEENQNTKHTFIPISMLGDPLQVIKNVVEDKDIEMIVMGTRGAGKGKKVFGSIATYVMEKARNCPVIVVPEVADCYPPIEIVFPTSYKTHFKKRELEVLIDIAKKWNSTIKILHVSEEDELDNNQIEHREMLEEYFEGLNYSYHTLTNIKVQTAINCFIESTDGDMVTFVNKKHPFFGSLLTHPLVKEIGFQSKVPILVMHDLRN